MVSMLIRRVPGVVPSPCVVDGSTPKLLPGLIPFRSDALQARFFALTFFHEFAARPPGNFKCISLHAAYTKLMLKPAIAVGPLAIGPLALEPMRVEVVGRTWMFCSRSAAMMLFICRS